jgi:hypothetical protein
VDIDVSDSDLSHQEVKPRRKRLHQRSPPRDLQTGDPLCEASTAPSNVDSTTAALDIEYFFIRGDSKLGTSTICKSCK